MIQSLEITGLRGFARTAQISFAIPNGTPGSGLSVIVGANNSGKSTVLEALRAMAAHQAVSFTQGRRNVRGGDKVRLFLRDASGGETSLETESGSSETKRTTGEKKAEVGNMLVLQSRRVFEPYFGKSVSNRRQFVEQVGFPAQRSSTLSVFAYRLFNALKDKARFDALLRRVMDPVPVWTIDQHDNGQYFVKITKAGVAHSSEGAGEGLVSLLYLVDALYDSSPRDVIVVDEPELSLHPAIQRKLAKLFVEYASDRQIILSTHSPYFTDVESLGNGAKIVRVFQRFDESNIAELSDKVAQELAANLRDANNPHFLGTNAREIFFVEEKIVLTEGQEDVVFLRRIGAHSDFRINAEFYGWGVGGASKMRLIASVLRDLGFHKVIGILDGDKRELAAELNSEFQDYHFFCIPAPDVRTKSPRPAVAGVEGLLDASNTNIRQGLYTETQRLFAAANAYLETEPKGTSKNDT